jgi:hypothetical protein
MRENHMRRLLIAGSLAGSFVVFALSIDLFDALFMFVFFGVTPLRAEPIPALEMLMVYSVAGFVVITYALRGSIMSLLRIVQRKLSTAHVS